MAIEFNCTCGKTLAAKDEFAGRKLRCPKCQTVLTIPQPSAMPKTPVVAPLATPTPLQPRTAPTQLLNRPILATATQEAIHLESTPVTAPPVHASPVHAPPVYAPPVHPSPTSETVPGRVATPIGHGLTATPVGGAVPARPSWHDESFHQMITPWRPGDEVRFATPQSDRDWSVVVDWLVPIAFGVALFFVLK
jgi:hypothetical protein